MGKIPRAWVFQEIRREDQDRPDVTRDGAHARARAHKNVDHLKRRANG